MSKLLARKLHVSWLLGWVAIGVLLGLAVAAFVDYSMLALPWIVAATALSIIGFINRGVYTVLLILFAGITLGYLRGSAMQHDLAVYQDYIDYSVTVEGTVSRDTNITRDGDSQRLRIKNVRVEGNELPGEVWLSTKSRADIKRSDEIKAEGELKEGFGNFAAAMFRARMVEVARTAQADVARDVRDWFSAQVRSIIGEPEASLGIGFLTGQRQDLPEDLEVNMRILGLMHIVVASGYHLNIVAGTLRRLIMKTSKYWAVLVSAFVFTSFLLVTGFHTSMVRATLVGGMGLAAWYFGRKVHPFVLLPVAAAITAAANPLFLWGDLGWYLSFAAFSGVIVLAPLLNNYFFADKGTGGILRHIMLATVSAQIFTLPIILYSFGQYSLYALIANLMIVPFVGFAMLLTFLSGILASIAGNFAVVAAYPAEKLIGYIIFITERLSVLPYAQNEMPIKAWEMAVSYMAIAVVIFVLIKRTGYDLRGENMTY